MLAATTPRTSSALLDPRMQPIVDRVLDQVEAAAVKVAAHHAEPRSFPLPDSPGSLERVLERRFQQLPEARRQLAASRLQPLASGNSRPTRGSGAVLDLASSAPVAQQLRGLPLALQARLGRATLERLAADPVAVPRFLTERSRRLPIGRPGAVAELTRLELRIHEVRCIDDTREAGRDEVAVGVILTNVATNTTFSSPVNEIGQMRAGDVASFANPLRFQSFDLREGELFPKDYLAVLCLGERDLGGFESFLDEFVDTISDELVALLTALAAGVAGGASAGTVGGPLGALLGALVGAVVALGIALLKRLWGDEVFDPQPATPVTVTALTDRFPGGGAETAQEVAPFFGFGGFYEVAYSWRMF